MNIDDAMKVADNPGGFTAGERSEAYRVLYKAAWATGAGDAGFMYQDAASKIWVYATDQGDDRNV